MKHHSLTLKQRKELLEAGFVPKEIRAFDGVKSTDFNLSAMQKVIKDRIKWRDCMLLAGWNKKDIARRIYHWYKLKKERSIWDIFRLEYGLVTDRKRLSKDEFLRLRADVSRGFGRAYGRIKSTKYLEKYGLRGIPKKKIGR